jgi:hypothetical protein
MTGTSALIVEDGSLPLLEASPTKTEASLLTLETSPPIFEAGILTLEAFPFILYACPLKPETSY